MTGGVFRISLLPSHLQSSPRPAECLCPLLDGGPHGWCGLLQCGCCLPSAQPHPGLETRLSAAAASQGVCSSRHHLDKLALRRLQNSLGMGTTAHKLPGRCYLASDVAAWAACDMLRPATRDMTRMPAARCMVWIQSVCWDVEEAAGACTLPAACSGWECWPSLAALAEQQRDCRQNGCRWAPQLGRLVRPGYPQAATVRRLQLLIMHGMRCGICKQKGPAAGPAVHPAACMPLNMGAGPQAAVRCTKTTTWLTCMLPISTAGMLRGLRAVRGRCKRAKRQTDQGDLDARANACNGGLIWS